MELKRKRRKRFKKRGELVGQIDQLIGRINNNRWWDEDEEAEGRGMKKEDEKKNPQMGERTEAVDKWLEDVLGKNGSGNGRRKKKREDEEEEEQNWDDVNWRIIRRRRRRNGQTELSESSELGLIGAIRHFDRQFLREIGGDGKGWQEGWTDWGMKTRKPRWRTPEGSDGEDGEEWRRKREKGSGVNTETRTSESEEVDLTPPSEDGTESSGSGSRVMLNETAFLDRIHPADRTFARTAIGQFGLEPIANIYTKNWRERCEGMDQMAEKLGKMEEEEEEDGEGEQGQGGGPMVETAIPVMNAALRDDLFKVFLAGISLFSVVHAHLIASGNERLQKNFAREIGGILAKRLVDTDKRFAKLAEEAVEKLLNGNKKMTNWALQTLLKSSPIPKDKSLRAEMGRAEFVRKALHSLWATPSAPSLRRLCPFIGRCLDNSHPEIRAIGRNLALFLYAHSARPERRLLRHLLPLPDVQRDAAATARPDYRQLVQLHREWAQIDEEK